MGIKEVSRSLGRMAPGVALVGVLALAGCRGNDTSTIIPAPEPTPTATATPLFPTPTPELAPNPSPEKRGWVDFESPSFKMEIYSDWTTPEVREGDGAIIIRAKDFKTIGDTDISIFMMDLSLLKRDISLQALVDQQMEMAKQSKSIMDGKIVIAKAAEGKGLWLIDNHDARKVDTEYIDEKSGEVLIKMVHFFIKDQATNTIWTFRFSVNSSNFDDEFTNFQAMLATFELTNADVSQRPNTEMRDFKSQTLPFEMKLAPGWTTDDEGNTIWITKGRWLNTPEEKGLIVITAHKDKKMSVDEYTRHVADLPPPLGYTHTKIFYKTKVNGQPANRIHLLEQLARSPDTLGVKDVIRESVIYVFEDGGYLWEIRFDPSLPEFKKSVDDFDRMVSTFHATGELN